MLVILWLFPLLVDRSFGIDHIYHIEEEQIPGTFVGNIAVDTQTLGIVPFQEKNLIWFSTLQQDATTSSQLFNVSESGKLYTAKRLDAEALCKYNTECFQMVDVAVRNKESFVKILEIKIIIEDVNDNQPEFPEKQINLQFSETDGRGTAKFIPNAIDKDVGVLNSKISYHLKKNLNDPFILSVSKKVDGTDSLELILQEKLNRETNEHYKEQIIARDEGFPTKQGFLEISISVTDVNDNLPIFSQNLYNVSVNNGFDRSRPIITLSATDLDSGDNGKISYLFSSKTSALTRTFFRLDKETGDIYIIKDTTSGSKNMYKLYVKATDGGNPPSSSTAVVLVYINNNQNNAPVIDLNFISKSAENKVAISEGVKIGSFIAFMKITDNDIGENGNVSCDLNNNGFQLKSLGLKKYKVVVMKQIDKEKSNHVDLVVTCEDHGSPPLKTVREFSIQVLDVNDVQPHFTKDTFKFLTYENEEPNFPVGYINATDPDLGLGGQLTYSLIGHSKGLLLPFEISDFGFISTTQPLDREQQEVFNFKVLVKDNGIPSLNSTAVVVVEVMDKNDNTPYFTFPSVNPFNLDVHYHPQSKSDITTLRASDRDSHVNSFLRYEIFGGNNKQLFKVNPYTGVLSFSRTVYQNDAGAYNLELAVKDSGTPVLSATTTLFLTLTVSNTTARMYISEDTESDNRIHINLMIIIVVAAVIVSVAIVVSVTVCIVRRNHNRDILYTDGIDQSSKFIGDRGESEYMCQQMTPQNDGQVIMVTHPGIHPATVLRRDPHSDNTWKSSSLRHQQQQHHQQQHPEISQGTYQMCFQDTAVTSGAGKKEKHLNESSTISSRSDDCGPSINSEGGNNGLYETLAGVKTSQPEQLKVLGSEAILPQTLSNLKDTSTRCFYQPNVTQNAPSNDVIDLKSLRITSASPSQPWNLPMRNSFTSYAKPLPAVPKIKSQ
ncbi:protocadherin beta-15 isoform X2 [Octopus sinensis]|uniref:Protocadherin beta-15 isoform X2 n=1 Tax=Octopus sinensis TaxID=2607531 RepID=A0A7E6FBH8_9MOLL|nr:protocadherin beta-15 isoform X2 [Octopus sinensis]XP_036365112.1 protocadherin beta-15 isoform X2 [Octopus sinensis]XP_036365113.1 protocadherin beta-15 isoform X2 [Octopus sinensis]XP_036365114.1 protocadherin beta-15 isoform X2 [Octopus sinensis]